MNRIFDNENPLMQTLSIIADMLVLNLLTLICSLPIVTAGAAVTAMNAVVIRVLRQEEGSSIALSFFRAFRENLKKGCLFGLLLVVAAALLYFDYLAASAYCPPLRFGVAAIAVLVLALAIYCFALLARYENSLWASIRNAAMLAVGFFPKTLAMLGFCLAFWMLCIHFIRWGAPILIMFGLSLPCYASILLMRSVFKNLEETANDRENR